MNSCACAARAAASTASCGASGIPSAMLSRIDAEKRNGSCEMTPISRRSDRRARSRTSTPSTSDAPRRRVVEPRNERRERRLARAGRPDQRDRPPGRDLERRRPRAPGAPGRSRTRRPRTRRVPARARAARRRDGPRPPRARRGSRRSARPRRSRAAPGRSTCRASAAA